MNELPKIVPIQTQTEPTARFLQDLETELAWEWKWVRWNRAWTFGFIWAGWGTRIILLAAAIYQLNTFAKEKTELWLIALIAVLSTLNIALPFISIAFRFAQRLEVHDRTARDYDVIRVELRAEQIGLSDAVDRYKKIRKKSPEIQILEKS